MKISKSIRRKAIKRILKRYNNLQTELTPYGFEDCMKYYNLIDYWESKLKLITK